MEVLIRAICLANFGETEGSCSSEQDVVSLVEKQCVGKEKCLVQASESVFGMTNCGNKEKKLIVEAVC